VSCLAVYATHVRTYHTELLERNFTIRVDINFGDQLVCLCLSHGFAKLLEERDDLQSKGICREAHKLGTKRLENKPATRIAEFTLPQKEALSGAIALEPLRFKHDEQPRTSSFSTKPLLSVSVAMKAATSFCAASASKPTLIAVWALTSDAAAIVVGVVSASGRKVTTTVQSTKAATRLVLEIIN